MDGGVPVGWGWAGEVAVAVAGAGEASDSDLDSASETEGKRSYLLQEGRGGGCGLSGRMCYDWISSTVSGT